VDKADTLRTRGIIREIDRETTAPDIRDAHTGRRSSR
jgi:hypothetical protein